MNNLNHYLFVQNQVIFGVLFLIQLYVHYYHIQAIQKINVSFDKK